MNKKLIIALALVLVMVFSFVACKDTADDSKEPTDAENTTAEITTDEDGFADFGSEDDTTGGKKPNNNNNSNNGGNDLVISPDDGEGAGFEDVGENGNSSNGGTDIVIGDGNGEDSLDWNELG